MATEDSRHILVVDDESAVLHLITALLKTHGYKTLSATNGREAFALFKEHEDDINLLITDVVMPEMDGIELAVQVRSLRRNLPVLFVSGFCEEIPGSLQQWEGVDKPFKPQELLKKIADILTSSKGRVDQRL
jgi:two-component system cell cycle sensor histidine kinase/response regulator CckA